MGNPLDEIRNKKNRVIVGIETGNTIGRIGAAAVDVTGHGDDTLIDFMAYNSVTMSPELVATLQALKVSDDFDSEDTAGINFLILHQISSLYQDLLDQIDGDAEEIDLIGLKCMEIARNVFPENPAVLSEMTGAIVATHFSIRSEDGEENPVPVDEQILQSMVDGIAKKFDLDKEAREAVCVAMLANESLCWQGSGSGPSKRSGCSGQDKNAGLFGEFFFPA
ncbi:MAG: hypothetical protein JW746_09740 [Candidatus Krumholzibacteriota bacterium]|nr:hypothetical protein [Candidatus Krumholzibacteriota bacterium]